MGTLSAVERSALHETLPGGQPSFSPNLEKLPGAGTNQIEIVLGNIPSQINKAIASIVIIEQGGAELIKA